MRENEEDQEPERGPPEERARLAATYAAFVKGAIIVPIFLNAAVLVFQSANQAADGFERAHYTFMKTLAAVYVAITIGAFVGYSKTGGDIWLLVLAANWGLLMVLAKFGKNRSEQGRLPGK